MFSGAKYKQSTNPLEYSNLYRENCTKKTLASEEIDRVKFYLNNLLIIIIIIIIIK